MLLVILILCRFCRRHVRGVLGPAPMAAELGTMAVAVFKQRIGAGTGLEAVALVYAVYIAFICDLHWASFTLACGPRAIEHDPFAHRDMNELVDCYSILEG
jgi:hypothetical protein